MKQGRSIAGKVALIAIALAIGGFAARAEERDRRRDHDVARQGLEQKEILPLETVLAAVRAQVAGEIAGIELEHERGAWVYEIKMISPSGAMQEVCVDAQTGVILKNKGK